MFTDALQDDRRDITRCEFPRAGVLEDLAVVQDRTAVTARVCLPRVPLRYWPGKIAEYESVLLWINRASDTKFAIDYTTSAGL
jgi:hypothetical protein